MSKKLVIASQEGDDIADINAPVKKCCVCKKENVKRCSRCHSTHYCSKACQESHHEEHSKYCASIESLMKQEVNKVYGSYSVREREVPVKTRRKVMRLVGERPMVKCFMEDKEFSMLWDTGSMISMVDRNWVKENFPDKKVYPVSDFVEEELKVKAVNTTEIPYDGVIMVKWSLSRESDGLIVPVLVSRQKICDPILGSNVIEHIISENNMEDMVALKSSLGGKEGIVEALMAVIKEKEENLDFLAEVKVPFNVKIPGGMKKSIKCRIKVPVNGEEQIVHFRPLLMEDGSDEVIFLETVETLKRGHTNYIYVEVLNPTSQEKLLEKGKILGSVHEVSAVIPMVKFQAGITCVSDQIKDEEKMESEDGKKFRWDLSHLNDTQKELLEKVLHEEEDIFSRSDTDIGDIPGCQMRINLTDDIPVNEAYRRIPPHLYKEMRDYIHDLVMNGWVRESFSSYSSPIVCVRKKCGAMRMCVDYRKLNAKTIPDAQPIPKIQHLLDTLAGQRWFTTLDMSKAYHQGYIHEDSRHMTAFSTPWALYEWMRIPFGLRNAPPAFQRFMNQMLGNLKGTICEPYLDDVLIYGKSFEEHVENLRKVLQRLKQNGVKLRADKCVFGRKEVRYLGRLVSEKGYRPDPADTLALDKFKKAPENIGELRRLLGFIGYFRCYVKDFAKKMKPLYDLLKMNKEEQEMEKDKIKRKKVKGKKKGQQYDARKKILWTFEHQGILNAMIDYLKSPEIISFPDFDLPFFITCDASGHGLGAVLYQNQNGKDRVISYASRTLTDAEKNYHFHSGKLEFLALKWAITERFSDYLQFGQPFEVFTDNNPLTYILTSAKVNAVGARWINELADYNFVIKYRPGKENVDADGLSRNPIDVGNMRKECFKMMDEQSIRAVWSGNKDISRTVYADSVEVNTLVLPKEEELISVSAEVLREKQNEDPVISPVYRAVKFGMKPGRKEWKNMDHDAKILMSNFNKLVLKNDVLMRKTVKYEQIVLPTEYRQLVYDELHVKMAHLGAEKTIELARQRFYWPRMAHDIEFYIRKKCRCLVNKSPNVKEMAPLKPIQANHPFQMITIDYLHLDKCKGGFEYVLMVTDHFTRFSQMFATKNKSAMAAADKIFNCFILQFGYPEKIFHDQGREFNNKLFKELHRLTGIRASNSTPYHPQSDGMTERMNRTLINMLKALSREEKKDWKNALAKLAFAYNSTIHKSTGFTPFYLMFGRESRLPIDTVFRIEDTGEELPRSWKGFVNNWKETMKQAYKVANDNIGKAAGYNKKYFDKNHKMARPVLLTTGDKVLVRNVRQKDGTGKLRSYWEENIFVVLEKKEDLPVYKIKNVKKNSDVRTVHRNLLLSCENLPLNVFDEPRQLVKQNMKNKTKKPDDCGKEINEGDDSEELEEDTSDIVAICEEEEIIGDSFSDENMANNLETNEVSQDEEFGFGVNNNSDGLIANSWDESSLDETFHGFPSDSEEDIASSPVIRRSVRNRQPTNIVSYDEEFNQISTKR